MSEHEQPAPRLGIRVGRWVWTGTRYPSALQILGMVRDMGRWLEREPPVWGVHPDEKTPHVLKYRSPEEWRFRQEHLGQRDAPYQGQQSDVLYSMGVFLYQLLTRRYPFEATEGERAVKAILHQPPAAPHRLNAHVPRKLGELCLRLLEKTPEKRPPSIAALCAEVEVLMKQADDTWRVPLFPARKRPVLPPWAQLALTGVVLMVLSGAAGWLYQNEVAPPSPPPVAVQEAMPPPEEEPFPIEEEEEVPQVGVGPATPPTGREEPRPEDCPAGAVEAMRSLRIILRPYTGYVSEEEAPAGVRVSEGDFSLTLEEYAGKLPYRTVLSGRLHYTPGRLYIRLTRARTPSGEEHPICMEIREGRTRGARLEKGRTPDDIRLNNLQRVWPVERFE